MTTPAGPSPRATPSDDRDVSDAAPDAASDRASGAGRVAASGPGRDARCADRDDSRSPDLSVVIVTYDEGERIATCLDAVLAATRDRDAEIVLVDSNSTDDTVERAAAFPIAIYRITDDRVTTPGAGRFVGTQVTRGDRVLFVDGDMAIRSDWLDRALAVLDTHPDVAGVDGQLNTPAASDSVEPVDSVRGVALYRRSALDRVGGFDPFLRSVEDIHLGFELRAAGYRCCRLPEVAAEHPERRGLSEPLRRWRRGYAVGPGQALRRSLFDPGLLAQHLARMRYRLALGVWAALGVATLAVPGATTLWILLSALALAGLAIARGPREAIQLLVSKGLGLVGVARGLAIDVRPRSEFPMRAVECVQSEDRDPIERRRVEE
ncbi:glycosyltransferase [Halococcoides cellulosivorans]|uniref:Family 2 glycosyl transferase n=1 Tax=Halococcoides cellulosivorans TaxID=1679096 RepID=A0A2R4X3D3_9EURY|nr:glycosyltransferase family 2 protein [Halococcoides cellulosivorans]AWB28310.1 family 2 glycosyl transferase [Halococcoides cellulosivorans]